MHTPRPSPGPSWHHGKFSQLVTLAGRAAVVLVFVVLTVYSVVDMLQNSTLQQVHTIATRRRLCPNDTKQVTDVCRANSWTDDVIPNRRYYGRLLVDDKHHVMYCAIPKAACSTFKTLFVMATGLKNQTEASETHVRSIKAMRRLGLRYLNSYDQPEIRYRLKTYRKFVVVRHPWDRLMSAYHNKFVNGYLYPRKAAPVIKSVFGDHVKYDSDGTPRLTLEQFLVLIVKEYKRYFNNVHWMSYQDLCHPCNIKYNAIIKLENIHRRLDTVMTWFMGDHNVTLSLSRNTREDVPEGWDRLANTSETFRRLPSNLVEALYTIYQEDFNIFGYRWSSDGGATCSHHTESGECC